MQEIFNCRQGLSLSQPLSCRPPATAARPLLLLLPPPVAFLSFFHRSLTKHTRPGVPTARVGVTSPHVCAALQGQTAAAAALSLVHFPHSTYSGSVRPNVGVHAPNSSTSQAYAGKTVIMFDF